MKKFALVVILVLASLLCFGQAEGYFSMGAGCFINAFAMSPQDDLMLDYDHVYVAKIEGKVPILKYGFVEASVETPMLQTKDQFGFFPYLSTYNFGVGITIGGITAGWQHSCTHPVRPRWMTLVDANAAYELFYVEYKVRFR